MLCEHLADFVIKVVIITIEKVFSNQNMQIALTELMLKNDTCGMDGMYLHELPEYLQMNKQVLRESLLKGEYKPGAVRLFEIVAKNGKIRKVTQVNTVDRFVSRCIFNELSPLVSETQVSCSYAYQKGKSIQDAASKCRDYAMTHPYVLYIDFVDYFGSIDHEILDVKLYSLLKDRKLMALISELVHPPVTENFETRNMNRGIIQGSVLSPCISNLYLNELDQMLESKGCDFVRYADDVKIFADSEEDGLILLKELEQWLEEYLKLQLNMNKTVVVQSDQNTYFGYTLRREGSSLLLRRKPRNHLSEWYREWTSRALTAVDGQFHILEDGILSKKDLTILFENEDIKQYLPAESIADINTYADMIYSSGFFELMNRKRITVQMFDKHGVPIGRFIPENISGNASYVLKQAAAYNDAAMRLEYARTIEIAIMRNILAQLRYYRRHIDHPVFIQSIDEISELIKTAKRSRSVDELLLSEARVLANYYQCVPIIIGKSEFLFNGRNRRPPRDEINAMMSFGNSFLYNRIFSIVRRTNLDGRISFLHSSSRRKNNLCLDLADIYKPFIVDSVIFTMVNKRMINPVHYFDSTEDGAVYLNKEGIHLFVRELKDKLSFRIKEDGKAMTYLAIIRSDIQNLKKSLDTGEEFTPYVRNN